MRLARTVHLQSGIGWAPLKQVAPDVQVQVQTEDGVGDPPALMALSFTDPDGETHIFVLDQTGKENLLKQLTGGLVLL